MGSPAIGAAEGQVRFIRTPADNVEIDLTVKHLPDPAKMVPPAWAYVAWIRGAQGGPPLNIGALYVGKDATGELKTVTQLREFELFVTAEPVGAAERPSGEPLLWTSRNASRYE